jgi:tetratricopeptide (TPR) repeat protein
MLDKLKHVLLGFSILVALLAASCEGPMPPVPAPQVEGFDPVVRDAILTAHSRAVAEPSSGQASGQLGMVLQAHAVYPPALLAYERAIRLEPKEFAWRYYYALVVWQLSGPEKGAAPLAAALRVRPGYAPAVLKNGDLLYQLGRFQESGDAYKALLSEDPGSAEALYGIARVKYAQHDMAAAQEFYSRACRAYASFGAAYYGLALAEQSQGRTAEAAQNFELAQRYDGDHPPRTDPLGDQILALATGVSHLLAEGDRLARKGRVDEAAELNETILARDPENFSALLNLLYLARFVERLGNKVDAYYTKAQRLNPQDPIVYDYYGGALARQRKYEAAAAVLRKAIDLKPDYAEAQGLLAEVLETQNRPAEAIEHYRRALAAQPSDHTVQMKLWRLLIVQGRSREAIPQLLPALQVDDSYATLRRVLLGEAYLTTGDRDQARRYLEQARGRALNEGPRELVVQIDQELQQIARH